jgi:hypothetical protein
MRQWEIVNSKARYLGYAVVYFFKLLEETLSVRMICFANRVDTSHLMQQV